MKGRGQSHTSTVKGGVATSIKGRGQYDVMQKGGVIQKEAWPSWVSHVEGGVAMRFGGVAVSIRGVAKLSWCRGVA